MQIAKTSAALTILLAVSACQLTGKKAEDGAATTPTLEETLKPAEPAAPSTTTTPKPKT